MSSISIAVIKGLLVTVLSFAMIVKGGNFVRFNDESGYLDSIKPIVMLSYLKFTQFKGSDFRPPQPITSP